MTDLECDDAYFEEYFSAVFLLSIELIACIKQ